MLPHMAMAEACAILGVDLNQIQFTQHTITLPLQTGQRIIIPVHNDPEVGQYGAFMDVPFFGTKDWLYSYDVPNHQEPKQHIPLNTVWRICELRRDIESLNGKTDYALKAIVQVYRTSLPKASAFVDQPAEKRDNEHRVQAIDDVIEQIGSLMDMSVYDKMKPSDYNEDEKLFVPAYQAVVHSKKSLQIDLDRINAAQHGIARTTEWPGGNHWVDRHR